MARSKGTHHITELVYGVHPIRELLKAKRRKIMSFYTTKPEPKALRDIKPLLDRQRVKIQYVTREALKNIAKTTDHQGMVAWAAPYQFRKKPFDPKKQDFLLLLDGIQDPRNLGAILRTAYCTNVNGVLVTQKFSAALNAVVHKSAAGLSEHLEVMMVPSAKIGIKALQESGYSAYVTTVDGSADVREIQFQKPMCLVVGSEGVGVSRDILSLGTRISLPQRASDMSYNASVAAGILLFSIATQQGKL